MRDIPIDRIMTLDPATVSPRDGAAEARRILDSNVIHHLPVVENGRLVGIVSSSDLLKLHLLDENLAFTSSTTVAQIMETQVVVIERDATMRDAAEKLSMGGFHALPVVGPGRKLVGIVTSGDLVTELLKQMPA